MAIGEIQLRRWLSSYHGELRDEVGVNEVFSDLSGLKIETCVERPRLTGNKPNMGK